MATPALAILHTAALRLREAADRFIVAFEQAAAEAAGSAPAAPVKCQRAKPRPSPTRKTLRSPSAVQITSLAGTERGITAAEVARVLEVPTRSAHGRLAVLATRGHLVRVALPGQTVRFFANADHATAWGGAEGGPPPLDTPDALDVATAMPGAVVLSSAAGIAYNLQSVRPSSAMDGVDIDAVHHQRQHENRLAAMVEADAPAVAAALAVIAPQPTPSAPPPKPYIPPTPAAAQRPPGSEAANAKRAADAGMPRPTGETIVPPDVKRTVATAPAYDLRFGVDPKAAGTDPESFSAQWKRLRGEGSQA